MKVIAISIRTNHYFKGEASWNVTWDTWLARWLRRSDSAWLLFGAFGNKDEDIIYVILDLKEEILDMEEATSVGLCRWQRKGE
ncbi:uncharacterized protein HKW66_Vig0119630 [Vigna angularis]|uniref:Uncharacterized protein n=1 Tax=Phaseolus angularis TaxID=3914 RepID=A0A8T0JZ11_PHAAN|nr:uncharacterized protein HKW66_Vig0119630 [Vigna angularis]